MGIHGNGGMSGMGRQGEKIVGVGGGACACACAGWLAGAVLEERDDGILDSPLSTPHLFLEEEVSLAG